jgi:hypothetical protein
MATIQDTDHRQTLMLKDSDDLLLRKHEQGKRSNRSPRPSHLNCVLKVCECRSTRRQREPLSVRPRRERLPANWKRVCIADGLSWRCQVCALVHTAIRHLPQPDREPTSPREDRDVFEPPIDFSRSQLLRKRPILNLVSSTIPSACPPG